MTTTPEDTEWTGEPRHLELDLEESAFVLNAILAAATQLWGQAVEADLTGAGFPDEREHEYEYARIFYHHQLAAAERVLAMFPGWLQTWRKWLAEEAK